MTAAAALADPPLARRSTAHSCPRAVGARALWNLAAIVVIWATSLVVIAVWVAGGEVQSLLAGGADSLNALGRAAGLASANLLFFQVLLMARVPLFERGFGRDGITRMHRLVGFWSFALFTAHIVLQILGYAVEAGINPIEQGWQFVWDYPDMLLATAGTGLLLLVVVTSVRRARRRLRYESWHLLHLYGYLGVGLAIPHMLWTGADFAASPAATVYWWAMWGVTAATVIVFRLGMPLALSLRHGIRVGSVERDGRNGVAVRMAGRRTDALRARGGERRARPGGSVHDSRVGQVGPVRDPAASALRAEGPPQGAEAREELVEIERLQQVVVRSGVEPFDAVGDGSERREHEHGGRDVGGAQVPHDLRAVEAGEPAVEQDDVEALPEWAVPAGDAVALVSEVVRLAQHLDRHLGDLGVVFDVEHARSHGLGFGHRTPARGGLTVHPNRSRASCRRRAWAQAIAPETSE